MSDMKETSEIRLKYEGNMGFVPNHKLDIQVSDTPRTDAEYDNALEFEFDSEDRLQDMRRFSKKLERELNVANEKIKRLEEAGDAMVLYATTPTKTAWKQAKEDKP